MSTRVELNLEGGIARITFRSDNGMHILRRDVRNQLAEILTRLEGDENCRVVIFAAEGRTFCAGADLHELRSLTTSTAEQMSREGQALMTRISRLPQPTIAALHAVCAGGGCELSLACDLRLGAASCRIGLPETSIGIIPGWGGTVRAMRILGPAAARRVVLAAELWSAPEALQLGLLHAVYPDADFADAVAEQAESFLTRGPKSMAAAKELMEAFAGDDIEEQLLAEARAFAAIYATGEPQAGITAFLEKRPPIW